MPHLRERTLQIKALALARNLLCFGYGLALLQKDILRYLVQHTEAKDTVQGVFHWWLPPTHVGLGEAELAQALDDLVARGWLTMSSHAPGSKLYGIAISRRDEILRWLEE